MSSKLVVKHAGAIQAPAFIRYEPGIPSSQSASFSPSTDAGIGLHRVAHSIYKFANDGGAISTITPVLKASLPTKAIILDGIVNVTTAPTGVAGATVSIGTSAGSAVDSILAATVIASLGIGLYDIVPVGTAATAVKLTAAGDITFSIAVHALTAGVIEVWLRYVVAS